MTRHEWFQDAEPRYCYACGQGDCTGRIAVEFCPQWQESQARADRGEYLTNTPCPGFSIPAGDKR